MLTRLLAAQVKDIAMIVRDPAFFAAPKASKQKHLKTLPYTLPAAIQAYLEDVEVENFVEDIQGILALISSGKDKISAPILVGQSTPKNSLSLDQGDTPLSQELASDIQRFFEELVQPERSQMRENGFVRAWSQMLTQEVAAAYDGQASEQTSELNCCIKAFIQAGEAQQLAREIQEFLSLQYGAGALVVQLSTEISPEQKQRMRAELQKAYPGTFAIFKTESSLAGGMRVFYQGALIDHSWMSQISHMFAKLHSLR